MRFWFSFILFFFLGNAMCQENTLADTTQTKEIYKSPKTAAILSAIVPGAGQVYNRKYWKVPIVYGGLAACLYYIKDNTTNFKYYTEQYIALNDGDPNTVVDPALSAEGIALVEENRTTYKKWLDLSYASLGVVYVLNILDASVDAHLFSFDVSEDLSLHWQPTNQIAMDNRMYTGVKFSIHF